MNCKCLYNRDDRNIGSSIFSHQTTVICFTQIFSFCVYFYFSCHFEGNSEEKFTVPTSTVQSTSRFQCVYETYKHKMDKLSHNENQRQISLSLQSKQLNRLKVTNNIKSTMILQCERTQCV